MMFNVGDRMVLAGIECEVALVNGAGAAYLRPLEEGEMYNNYPTLKGLVFAVVDVRGRDKLGNKVMCLPRHASGAV